MAAMIAVYTDRQTAEAVATDLREHHHVPDTVVHVGELADRQRALQAEIEEAGVERPAAHGFTAAAMVRGAVRYGAIGALIGAVVGLPVGYFLFDQADSVLTRVGVGALIWMLFGAVVGALSGSGIGPGRPAEPLTDEPGVPVRVDEATAELAAVLEHYAPIRIDTFDDGVSRAG